VAPWRVVLAATLGIVATALPAQAQLLGQYYPVGIPGHSTWFSDAVPDRPRTEYDPLGVRAGGFVVRPSVSESFGADSNISASPHPVASALIDTQGTVGVASDWSRDAIEAGASFDNRSYVQHPSASYTNWSAGLGGRIDIGRDHVDLATTHLTATTEATAIGTLGAGTPVTVALDSAHAGYQVSFGRFTVEPAFDVGIYRFVHGPADAGSEATNNRNDLAGSLSAGYELAPGSNLVAVASATNAAFIVRTPGVPTPDYNDISLVGGIDTRAGSLFRYRATIGYEVRTYASSQLANTAAPLAEFDAIWTPTRRTTVTGQISRSLQNAISTVGAASYTYTDLRLVVDHEYLRNVLLQALGEFQNADYSGHEGGAHGGTQHVVSGGVGATWLLDRKLSLIARVTYAQSTDATDKTLNQSATLAELTLQFHL
jgi:hypothetical protein